MKIIIPARGGSKRIPKKNLVDLNGKPLVYYTIMESLKVTNNVYVSTENTEIKNVAKKYGAIVLDRPEKLSTDYSKTEDVVEHFLEEIDVDGNNLFCVVQPTSPLLKSKYLKDGFDLMKYKFDSVISVSEERGYYWDSNGKPINFELGNRKRTQDHEVWFKENGSFYITTKDKFLENNILQNGHVGFIKMKQKDSIDIDDYEDLELVRRMML